MKDRHGNEWVLVPVELTISMWSALSSTEDQDRQWSAAIAAAPKFEAVEVDDAVAQCVADEMVRLFREQLNGGICHHAGQVETAKSIIIPAVQSALGPTLGLVPPPAADARIAELEAEVAALRADAERYRWICDGNGYFICPPWKVGQGAKADADAAIDAARAGGEGGS